MGKYEITIGDAKYEVEAPDFETANKDLKKHVQTEFNEKEAAEIEQQPAWQKPIQALSDVARVGTDTLAFGLPDYLAGGDQSARTAAARDRMGWAGTALDVGMLSRFLPTAVPKVVAALKGGPAARTAVGAATAAGEGAAYGAGTAATHDGDVGGDAGMGAVGGILGHGLGSAVNKVAKAFSPSDIPAATKILKVDHLKKPTNTQKIEATINKANEGVSGPTAQSQVQSGMKGLVLNAAPREFTPEQTRLMRKVYEPDLMTRGTKAVGNLLSDKMVAGGALASGGLLTMNPVAAAAIGGGMLAGGRALKAVSKGGTDEAVQNLRRTMHKQPKFKGPVSELEKARIANMMREGLLDYDD